MSAHIVTPHAWVHSDGLHTWQPRCTCGWRGQEYETHTTARGVADAHTATHKDTPMTCYSHGPEAGTPIAVGDLVRRGKGAKTWRVETIDAHFIWLAPVEGYTRASVLVSEAHRIRRVDAP